MEVLLGMKKTDDLGKTKCFIIGMVLSLSLQAKAFIPVNTSAAYYAAMSAAAASQVRANERHKREEETNELIKQGKMVDKNDKNKNQEISLPEAIALVAFASFLFFPSFIERFFNNNL